MWELKFMHPGAFSPFSYSFNMHNMIHLPCNQKQPHIFDFGKWWANSHHFWRVVGVMMDPTDLNPSQDSNVQRRRRWILFFFKRRDGGFWWGESCILGCWDILLIIWWYDMIYHTVIVIIMMFLHNNNISYVIFYTHIYIYIHCFADVFQLFGPCLFFWSHQGVFYCWMMLVDSGTSWVAMKPSKVEHWLFWLEKERPAVDGWNPAPVEVGSLSHHLEGFLHPRWLFGISSINSINGFFPGSIWITGLWSVI